MCTLHGLPVAFALTGAKADERETLLDLLAAEPGLVAARPAQTLIGDKSSRLQAQRCAVPGSVPAASSSSSSGSTARPTPPASCC